jgi:hypothetical protein
LGQCFFCSFLYPLWHFFPLRAKAFEQP